MSLGGRTILRLKSSSMVTVYLFIYFLKTKSLGRVMVFVWRVVKSSLEMTTSF